MRRFISLIIAIPLSIGVFVGNPNAINAATEPAKSWRFTCYAYRDVNRNGIFDMGDRPFAGLQIEMTRADGSTISSKSNINGFTPFIVSLGNKKKTAVYETGIYNFRAKIPSGFTTTSTLDRQTVEFIGQSNARGKLVPKELCLPIGVAPVLTISGNFVPVIGSKANDYKIVAISKDDQTIPVNLDESGNFSFTGKRGDWAIEVRGKNDEVLHVSKFTVSTLPVQLASINLNNDQPDKIATSDETLGFDDLLTSDKLFEIPSGYGELNWLNWIATHSQFYRGSGYVNLTTSKEYMAYNSSGMPSLISRDKPFDFAGVNVGVAWPRGEEEDVIFRAWRGDTLVYEDHIQPSDETAISFEASYLGITKLEIRSGNFERVVIDDFRYRK